MNKSKVYFIKEISPENVIKLYKTLGIQLKGNVALKLHSGEAGNQNFLRADFYEPIVNYLNATVVECNTAYDGSRNTTAKHQKNLIKHGFAELYNTDILDSNENNSSIILNIENGNIIKKDYVGANIKNYDSCLVVSHFKGHPMGGFGGALKQLSIGFASSEGKCYIHSAGKTLKQSEVWSMCPENSIFISAMADAAFALDNYFKDNICYINVMKNMSVDCDCVSNAEDPCLKDIGMLASLDPVAIDKACIDLVLNSNDSGVSHFMERVNSREGLKIFDAAKKLGFGQLEYELIEIK